ncbi:hypothetical protein [Niabella drilacis]|uniref:Uncharacterized protein n=1 Tax=Niabella drilacis (strain DSM 25811 / CCM 8410 / CCUG 62505 / LMG 26954 / E90) TaxID=1285928 RepID=A0A1G6VTT8_NIADE|nr:hypothetical protein [Niabella drilacis]SDD56246.1 hypothetical protein SAMN04487894_110127 [Niabella drilacis]
MNFDELKTQWNEEGADDVQVPASVEQLKAAQHPLDQLKKNMKKELVVQLIAIALIGIFPFQMKLLPSLFPIYYMAYALLVMASAYYLYHFYQFYSQVQQYGASTKDSLLELYYNLRLNMERYKSFSFLIMPFAYFTGGLLLYSELKTHNAHLVVFENPYLALLLVVVVTVLIVTFTVIWIDRFYGRYVKQLKLVLDALKEE